MSGDSPLSNDDAGYDAKVRAIFLSVIDGETEDAIADRIDSLTLDELYAMSISAGELFTALRELWLDRTTRPKDTH